MLVSHARDAHSAHDQCDCVHCGLVDVGDMCALIICPLCIIALCYVYLASFVDCFVCVCQGPR